jgi:hypothetical protein
MAQVHATFGVTLIALTGVFTVAAAVAGAVAGGGTWLERSRLVLTALLAAQVLLGLVSYAAGDRPGENLHILYGLAAVSFLPFAGSFAAEAPRGPARWCWRGAACSHSASYSARGRPADEARLAGDRRPRGSIDPAAGPRDRSGHDRPTC